MLQGVALGKERKDWSVDSFSKAYQHISGYLETENILFLSERFKNAANPLRILTIGLRFK